MTQIGVLSKCVYECLVIKAEDASFQIVSVYATFKSLSCLTQVKWDFLRTLPVKRFFFCMCLAPCTQFPAPALIHSFSSFDWLITIWAEIRRPLKGLVFQFYKENS